MDPWTTDLVQIIKKGMQGSTDGRIDPNLKKGMQGSTDGLIDPSFYRGM